MPLLFLSMPGMSEWIIIAFAGLWIYTIVVVAQARFKEGSSKTTWLLIVILLGFLGAILFWLVGKRYVVGRSV